MKVLFIVLDGLGDKTYKELGGKTPLEAAATPKLDRLAAKGINGLMYPFGPGKAPSSDTAHFRLFGYRNRDFPGRGYLEALGEGFDVMPGEVVFRTSFLTVEASRDGYIVTGREQEDEEAKAREASRLIKDLVISQVGGRFAYTGGRQGLLFLSGNVSADVTDSDALTVGMPIIKVEPLKKAKNPAAAKRTAQAANRFMLRAESALRRSEFNFLVLKWPGRKTDIPSFYELTSFSGVIVADGSLYRGLAKALGMTYAPSAPGDTPEDILAGGLAIAKKYFREGFDFAHVHAKAPDQAGHKKDPEFKKQTLQALDKAFKELKGFDDTLVLVTGDHATPCSGDMIHSGDGVPVVMAGPLCGADEVKKFAERTCRTGTLGTILGRDLMPLILNYTDRANYHGLRPYTFTSPARPTPDRVTPLKPTRRL